ncbi:MAG: ATP-binding protein [Synergistaceae bacterium]|nr:ATP-binding protein [Synergistaceae bacterium]
MDDYYPVKLDEKEINELALNMGIAHSLISRNYLTQMGHADIIELERSEKEKPPQETVRLIRIDAFNYDRNESIIEKLRSMFSALSMIKSRNVIFILNNKIDNNSEMLELYMGISGSSVEEMRDSYLILEQSVRGNFPGCSINQCFDEDIAEFIPELVYQNSPVGCSVSSVSIDAVQRGGDENFVQGMEKFADSMMGQPYTLMLIASPVSGQEILNEIKNFQELYTEISPYRTSTITLNETTTEGLTVTEGTQTSKTYSRSQSYNTSLSKTRSMSESRGKSEPKYDFAGSLIETGATLLGTAGSILLGVPGLSFAGGMLGRQLKDAAGFGQETLNSSIQTSQGETEQKTRGEQEQEGRQEGRSTARASNQSRNKGVSIQAVRENKYVSDMLNSIERQIERLSASLGQGAYKTAAYVISSDKIISETGASLYRSLVTGNQPDTVAVVNNWSESKSVKLLQDYLARGIHPRLRLMQEGVLSNLDMSVFVPCSEIPLHFFWPRKSLPGIPVSHYAEFARSIPGEISGQIKIGKVYHLGHEEKNSITLPADILCSHTFISGSPGSGKSNLSYFILTQLINLGVHFLVIEPAKGEYSRVIGGYTSKTGEPVRCFSVRGDNGELFSVNPFAFPENVTAFEHVEALLSVLETCWPMYAAMTDILKDAVIRIYEEAGWDMNDTGLPRGDEWHYPDFKELMQVLPSVIDGSNYSREVKDNYKGSLMTRIKSMVNGTNKRIFGRDCMTCEELFNQNIILDISGITSSENLALMMGILIIKLNEFRRAESVETGLNSGLKHVTLIEEAHNLLSRNQAETRADGPSVGRKSAELIVRAIAEMRSYGEGFIIVDQTPSKLDSSITANTAVKITFNLQNMEDGMLIGRAMSLTDEQMQDIPTLSQGVCIMRSRGWPAPVKVKVEHFDTSRHKLYKMSKPEEHTYNIIIRKARGDILTQIIRGKSEDAGDAFNVLAGSASGEGKLIKAFKTIKDGKKLSGDELTKLYTEIFETDLWFYAPEKNKLHEWDKYIRSRLSSYAILDKPEQDKVIRTLLTTQGKNVKPEILRAWLAMIVEN